MHGLRSYTLVEIPVGQVECLLRGEPVVDGLGVGDLAPVLGLLAVAEVDDGGELADPELPRPVQLRGHDHDDAVLVEQAVDRLQTLHDVLAEPHLVGVVLVLPADNNNVEIMNSSEEGLCIEFLSTIDRLSPMDTDRVKA